MTFDTLTEQSYKPLHNDEIPSIVIENGSAWTRVGYAGEPSPRHIITTRYGLNNGKFYFGDDVNEFSPGKEIYSPVVSGVVQDWNAIEKNWEYCYDELLNIGKPGTEATTETPLATTAPTWNSGSNKNKAAELAFEKFGVPYFTIFKNPVCTAYNSELPTSLVVDVGSSVASVTPISDGNAIQKASLYTRFAGDFLTMHISTMFGIRGIDAVPAFKIKRKTLLDLNQKPDPETTYRRFQAADITPSYEAYQTDRLIDEFKETTACVSDTIYQEGSLVSRVSRSFEFPDGFNTVFTSERYTTSEALFRPMHYPLPNVSLPNGSFGISELILQSLAKTELPHESIKILLNNIIICGGTTLLKGFADRLNSDLSAAYPHVPVRILQQSSPAPQQQTVWTGASILASMGHFEQNWVSKQEYEELGDDIVDKKFK